MRKTIKALTEALFGATVSGGGELNTAQKLLSVWADPGPSPYPRGPARPHTRAPRHKHEGEKRRHSRRGGVYKYKTGLAALHDAIAIKPSGGGATEFFGVRQQRRAWARRQTKNAAQEERRAARQQAGVALKQRQKARGGVERKGGLYGGLSTIYGEGHLGRLGRVRDQLTGKMERLY